MTDSNDRFIVNVYLTERRMNDNPFSVAYKKASEYRVIDRTDGTTKSFWSMKLAKQYMKNIIDNHKG